jgi:RNase P subunit RPR2
MGLLIRLFFVAALAGAVYLVYWAYRKSRAAGSVAPRVPRRPFCHRCETDAYAVASTQQGSNEAHWTCSRCGEQL